MRTIKRGQPAVVKFLLVETDHVTPKIGQGGVAAYLKLEDVTVNVATILQWRGRPGDVAGHSVTFTETGALSIDEDTDPDKTVITFDAGVTTIGAIEALIDKRSRHIFVAQPNSNSSETLAVTDDEFADEGLIGQIDSGLVVYARQGNGRWRTVLDDANGINIVAVGEAVINAELGVDTDGKGEYDLHVPATLTDFEGELSFHIDGDTGWDPMDIRVQVKAEPPVLHSGLSQATGVNTLRLAPDAADLFTHPSFLEGGLLIITGDPAQAGYGEWGRIVTFNDATLDVTLDHDWEGVADQEVGYTIIPALNAPMIAAIQSGLATAAALATVDGKVDTIDTNVDSVLADTDAIDTRLPSDPADASVVAGLIDALPTAAEIDAELSGTHGGGSWEGGGSTEDIAAASAEAVWDEPRAGHVAAGSFGEGVSVVSIATTALDAIRDRIMDYQFRSGRTPRGFFRRMDALFFGKVTGLLSSLVRAYRPSGAVVEFEADQDLPNGTREEVDVTGSETP